MQSSRHGAAHETKEAHTQTNKRALRVKHGGHSQASVHANVDSMETVAELTRAHAEAEQRWTRAAHAWDAERQVGATERAGIRLRTLSTITMLCR